MWSGFPDVTPVAQSPTNVKVVPDVSNSGVVWYLTSLALFVPAIVSITAKLYAALEIWSNQGTVNVVLLVAELYVPPNKGTRNWSKI